MSEERSTVVSTSSSLAANWREIVSLRLVWPLVLICLGVSLHALDALVVATMMPAMVAEIGGVNLVSMTISLYELGSVIASAACGLITLRYGIKTPMFVCTVLFAAGCLLSAVAPHMWVVLIGRLLQGLGGGGLLALSFVATAMLFPRHLLARAMGAVSVFWGASAFVGPLLGGVFVEYSTWRNGFVMFAILASLLSLGILAKIRDAAPSNPGVGPTRFPIWRLVYLTAGVLCIAYAGAHISLISSPAFLVIGIVCFRLFLGFDAKENENRLLPRQALSFRNPVGAAFIMVLCFSAASVALSIYGALIITALHSVSSLTAGYIIATPALGWAAASALVSGFPEHHDRKLIGVGMMLAAVALCGFAYSVPYGSLWLIAGTGLLEGTGFGIAFTFISRRICALVSANEIERATSSIATAQAIGYAVGASCIGMVANATGFAAFIDVVTMRFIATAIFLASSPIILIGLLATYRFVATEPTSDPCGQNGPGTRAKCE